MEVAYRAMKWRVEKSTYLKGVRIFCESNIYTISIEAIYLEFGFLFL
jgi:hypothetical protein